MASIPDQYKRVVENQVDKILLKYFDSVTPFSQWLFREAFPGCELVSIQSALPHQHRDHRKESGDPLAYGETDVEVIATIFVSDLKMVKVGLLIENKVDAPQMEKQGHRYRARADHRIKCGSWADHRCILFAPRSYLESQYSASDFKEDGWHRTVEYEEVAEILSRNSSTVGDARIILEATTVANSWNKPIPSAVQFWKDYVNFGQRVYPNIPVLVKTSKGSKAGGVWPSFFVDRLRYSLSATKQNRVQIVHVDNSSHVSLILKKVRFQDFSHAMRGQLDGDMYFAPAGGSWQSIRVSVPSIDPCLPFENQVASIHQVYKAAERFYHFYENHKPHMLGIPTVSV